MLFSLKSPSNGGPKAQSFEPRYIQKQPRQAMVGQCCVHPTGALSPQSVAELMSDPLFAEMRWPRQTGCGGINMHLTEACPNVL